jgi:hypothetical protein
MTPAIDLIIPIHDPSRPLERAVRSVLQSGGAHAAIRVNVVCHNLGAAEIEAILPEDLRGAVRLLEYRDGEPSPAGPFMHGIRSATAEYVSIMGSDDTLEPGALGGWLERARRFDADAVIPPERHASGRKVATPPTRPWRSGLLDPIRDRLSYRTAPLGLLRRSVVERLELDMPSRLRSGSDQLFGLKLWFSGSRIVYGRGLPRYVVGADARSRVTFTPRSAEEELRAVHELLLDPWVAELPARARRAIVTKSVRVHIFSAALVRDAGARWTDEDREYLAGLIAVAGRTAPGFEIPMSIADRRLVDLMSDPESAASKIGEALRARQRYGTPSTVLTRDPRGLLAVDGAIRFMVAARLL